MSICKSFDKKKNGERDIYKINLLGGEPKISESIPIYVEQTSTKLEVSSSTLACGL